MKRLKILGLVVGGLALVVVVVLVLAFTPAVQTWAVRKAGAGQPGRTIEVSRVDAGLSAAAVSDFRFTQDGMIVTVKGVSAKYSAWDYLKSGRINAANVDVQDLVVDMRNVTSAATPATAKNPAPQSSATAAKPTPFDGLLKQLQLPFDVNVGTVAVKGRALLPNDQTVGFNLKAARIETGQRGNLEWTVDFADTKVGAALKTLRTTGTLGVHIAPDRRIDLIEIEGTAAALGPNIPADQFRLNLRAEQLAAGSNENYTVALGRMNAGTAEPLLKLSATWTAAAREIAGIWELGIRTEQLAALLDGLGLPEIAANGAGKFAVKPDTNAASASGSLTARASQLQKLSPDLAAIGAVQLTTAFDGALADNIARLDKLELDLTAADGRKFAQIGLLQKVSFNLEDQLVTLADPKAEAARISLQSLPLAWAQSLVKPLLIESGDFSQVSAIEVEPDGSRVRVRSVEPLVLRAVTIRDAQKKILVDRLTLSVRPSLDYSASKVTAQLAAISLSMPAGDSVTGTLNTEVTNLPAAPIVAFNGQLQAKIVSALKPYLPPGLDLGPLTIAESIDGRLEGKILNLGKASTTVTREGGALLSSVDLLQPVRVDLQALTFAVAAPTAVAARVRLGEVPLAWGEAFVPKSKFSGSFAGATLEVTMRSADDLTIATTAPLAVRGASVTLDGKPFAQALDLSASFSATKRGNAVTYDLKKVDLRQGDAALATLAVAGEATLAPKFTASAKGSLDADVVALMKQPALAEYCTLARGQLTTTFEASTGDATDAKAALAIKNLVAKQDNRALGDLALTLRATVKPDGSGTLVLPLTLTSAARKSDLTIDGTFGKASDGSTFLFTGKVSGDQIVVDDFMPLAALAPSSAQPAPAARPGTTVVRAPSPAPRPANAPAPARNTARDPQPFWKGVNGKLELDLKRVRYGADAEISAILGRATISDSKLALDSLSGRFQDTPFKLAGAVAFSAPQPKPYTLDATVDANGFDVGAFLRAAAPKEEPQIETKVTIVGKLHGTGANLEALGHGTLGTFDVTGTKGVLRAMSKKTGAGKAIDTVATVAGAATAALALLGKAPPPAAVTGGVELVKAMNELAFDQITARIERPDEASLKITSVEFLSPFMRVRGSGPITRPAGAPDTPITDWPMAIAIEFGSKGNLAALFQTARVLGTATDDKGYTQLRDPLTIRGTPAKPDSSEFWKNVATAAATDSGGAIRSGLEGLFRKK